MDFKKLIDKALSANISDIEIYASKSSSTTISIFNGEMEKNQVQESKTFSIRAIYNGKMAYLTVEKENEDFDYIIDTLKNNALSITTLEEFEIFSGSENYPDVKVVDGGFDTVPMSQKVQLAKDLEKEAKAYDPRIVYLPYCRYVEMTDEVEIINSIGLNLKKFTSFAYVAVQAIAKDGNETQSSFEIETALKYDQLDPKIIGSQVAEKAISMLNAKPVDSKVYPVIFENEAMSNLFSVFTTFFSGEAAIKKLTPLLGKEGQKIFSEKVTMVDDPLYENSVNVQPFDDEGVACYRKEVVKDGEFVTLLHNLKTARYFKTTTTGNGFKAGKAGSVSVSGCNLYIESGSKSKEELISSINEGLLITNVQGLHAGANAITGDFSCQSSGFLIIDGKISRPVNLIVVSGNFLKIMNEIDEIGSDLKIMYTGIGSPSIKFTGLPVSGK